MQLILCVEWCRRGPTTTLCLVSFKQADVIGFSFFHNVMYRIYSAVKVNQIQK